MSGAVLWCPVGMATQISSEYRIFGTVWNHPTVSDEWFIMVLFLLLVFHADVDLSVLVSLAGCFRRNFADLRRPSKRRHWPKRLIKRQTNEDREIASEQMGERERDIFFYTYILGEMKGLFNQLFWYGLVSHICFPVREASTLQLQAEQRATEAEKAPP